MSLLQALNVSQIVEVSDIAFTFTFSRLTPLAIVETFALGVALTLVLIWFYWSLFIQPAQTILRPAAITLVGLVGFLILHWALYMSDILDLFWGRALKMPFILYKGNHSNIPGPKNTTPSGGALHLGTQECALLALLPFIVETAFFGVTTTLFITLCYITINTILPQARVQEHFIRGSARLVAGNSLTTTLPSMWYLSAHLVLVSINVVLSDAVVLWRMCVLWGMPRGLVGISIFFIMLTLCSSVANVSTLISTKALVHETSSELPTAYKFYARLPTFNYFVWGMITSVSSLLSNFTSTCMIAWKTWTHRKIIAVFLRNSSRRNTTDRVMIILVESGAMYCLLWASVFITLGAQGNCDKILPTQILWLISSVGKMPNVTEAFVVNNFVDYMNSAMVQLTAIYPLIIFLLVALERTHCNRGFLLGAPPRIRPVEMVVRPVTPIRFHVSTADDDNAIKPPTASKVRPG
ncbi:hypothetical protein PUNSTDRAFT_134488 [Punctularia strigosozonata HHB-11173 SS5]|uniref:uncharacterized protein n=1 Tax=Punctularia strigosozonata (strain HHB-11173) TaxID=741275 RepID=UPI0004416C87|nr:uncharacterized protein PUNSTDRAFT_134488 [Punctularia strigosozonata HHB-11173 SS5]EIN09335.1 hypothetical protein PUNSTDRAFT_134488 [Punctularia strigosozonata HHB-11173 SS5]